MNDDEQDYIAMLERTQIPEDHPLIRYLENNLYWLKQDGIVFKIPKEPTVDEYIEILESRGLGWSLDHTGHLIEARVWDWPYVVGRYRPTETIPLAQMLAKAMYEVDWTKYPKK